MRKSQSVFDDWLRYHETQSQDLLILCFILLFGYVLAGDAS